MRFLALFFLLGCASTTSCTQRVGSVDDGNNDNHTIINLIEAIENTSNQMLLSDVAEDIEIVPLETTERSALDDIRNLISFDSGLIAFTRKSRCVLFDKGGKFIQAYFVKGQGPEEVMYPDGAGYDERTKSLEIWGFATNTVSSYGLDGSFMRKIKVYRDMSAVIADGDAREGRVYRNVDGYHVIRSILPSVNSTNPWQILIKDSVNKTVAEICDPVALKYKGKSLNVQDFGSINYMSAWTERAPVLSFYKGTISVLFDGNDTIYKLPSTKDRILNRFLMKTNSEQIPVENIHKMDLSEDYLNKYIHPKDILESSDYVFLVCDNESNSYLVRFNKKTGKAMSIKTKGKVERSAFSGNMRRIVDTPEFTDDLTGGCSFFPDHTNDNEWIGVIPADRLLTEIDIDELEQKEVKLPHRKLQLIKVLKNLKEDDNPVLMIVKLK